MTYFLVVTSLPCTAIRSLIILLQLRLVLCLTSLACSLIRNMNILRQSCTQCATSLEVIVIQSIFASRIVDHCALRLLLWSSYRSSVFHGFRELFLMEKEHLCVVVWDVLWNHHESLTLAVLVNWKWVVHAVEVCRHTICQSLRSSMIWKVRVLTLILLIDFSWMRPPLVHTLTRISTMIFADTCMMSFTLKRIQVWMTIV